MSRFHSVALVFSLAAPLTFGATASADPLQITSGAIVVSGAQDIMSRGFLRSIGFDILVGDSHLYGGESDGITQNVLRPTLAGVGYWTVAEGPEVFVFVAHGTLQVDATPALTPTAFSLNGRLTILDGVTRVTLFDEIVYGSGIATWSFVTPPGGGLVVSGARYEFTDAAPTPEPGTLLLLGTGLVALAARQHRRNRGARG